MSVHTLLYRSVPVFSGLVRDYIAEIDKILASSRRRNSAADVTGALLFNEDWFVQLLEGDKAAVRETFERILLDSRHEKVELLFEKPTRERRLPGWSMAFVGDAPAIRHRFAESPLAAADVMMPGEHLVDFMVALADNDNVSGSSTRFAGL